MSFQEGYFLSAVKEALRKLPTAETFQKSHFGEILVGVYGEEILGLCRVYSKLAFLTAENANAYKMDILFYRPGTDPVQFVFAEVKSSLKSAATGSLQAMTSPLSRACSHRSTNTESATWSSTST